MRVYMRLNFVNGFVRSVIDVVCPQWTILQGVVSKERTHHGQHQCADSSPAQSFPSCPSLCIHIEMMIMAMIFFSLSIFRSLRPPLVVNQPHSLLIFAVNNFFLLLFFLSNMSLFFFVFAWVYLFTYLISDSSAIMSICYHSESSHFFKKKLGKKRF